MGIEALQMDCLTFTCEQMTFQGRKFANVTGDYWGVLYNIIDNRLIRGIVAMLKDYTIKEASTELNCSEQLIRKLIQAQSIRYYRIGRLIRIPREEISRIKGSPTAQI